MSFALTGRALGAGILLVVAAGAVGAQSAPSTSTPKHPAVCAKGVRIYTELSQVPVPHDTLTMPPSEPIRVTSPEEAEAAELAMRGRAGSVGATGVIVTEQAEESDGNRRVRRTTTAVYVPSEAARAQQACKSF